MDSSDDGQWLTYDEIAEARRTEKVGAIRWVQRHKWRRQPGNDGLVRILVPHEALVRTALRGERSQTVTPPDGTAAAFEAALAALREAHAGELAAVRQAHDSDLTVLREQLRTTETRHAEELAALREQLVTAAARHIDEVSALQEQLRTATVRHSEELAALRGQLDTTTLADGFAADLTALGEQLRTAENRAGAAQEAAETLQATVDELKVGRATQARELAVAQHDAQAGQQVAAELRRAEAERKARGLVARLRAAWRGQ